MSRLKSCWFVLKSSRAHAVEYILINYSFFRPDVKWILGNLVISPGSRSGFIFPNLKNPWEGVKPSVVFFRGGHMEQKYLGNNEVSIEHFLSKDKRKLKCGGGGGLGKYLNISILTRREHRENGCEGGGLALADFRPQRNLRHSWHAGSDFYSILC